MIRWLKLLPSALSLSFALAQPPDYRSIHAIEAEAHRHIVVKPVPARLRLAPLAAATQPNLTHTVFGFYPYWGPGYSQIRFQDITHLAYFSVEANGSGQLVDLRGWPNGPLIEQAHQHGVRVVLVCTLFNATQLQSLLSSSTARQTLINNLRNEVVRGGADGVNIDFEGVPGSQRANLVTFMSDLAGSIRGVTPGGHISIDTPAVDWSNAYDVAALADICDALMIMAYDYHWSTSPNSGPVSPLENSAFWGNRSVRSTITDYLSKAGTSRRGKLIMGVPYYGLDWPTASEAPNARTLAKSTARIFTEASRNAAVYGRRWDNPSSTPWYLYYTDTARQVWYDDAESLSRKYDLVFQYGIQGIGIWALTYDRDTTDLWNLIEERFAPPPVPEAPELLTPALFFDTVGLPVALQEHGNIPATGFQLAVGSVPDGTDLRPFTDVGLKHQVLIDGLNLESGKSYYVTARSLGKGGVVSPAGISAPIRIDTSRGPERRFIPRWILNDELYTGLAMVNPESMARAVLFRSRSSGSDRLVNASWVLYPGQQMATLLSEIDLLGSGANNHEGWLEVNTLGEEWPSLFLTGDNLVSGALDGGRLAASALSLVLPELDNGLARLAVSNPGSLAARLQIQLFRTNGNALARTRTLAPGEILSVRVSELFPEFQGSPELVEEQAALYVPSPFIRIDSDRAVVAGLTLQHGQDSAEMPALDTARVLKTGVFSYAPMGAGYRSQANLANPSGEVQQVEMRLISGSAARWVTLELPAYSSVTAELGALFGGTDWGGSSTSIGGAVEVRVARGSGILGGLWIRSEDDRTMATMPLEAAPTTAYHFPQLAQAQGYWTGMSLTNPGSTPAEVSVEAFDAAGVQVGIYMLRLAAGETRTGLLFEWIRSTQGLAAGRVEVRSTTPVVAAQIFGSDTLSFIAAVPGR